MSKCMTILYIPNFISNINECNKLRSLIQNVIERSIAITSHNEYDYVRIEYGKIIIESLIPKGNNDI